MEHGNRNADRSIGHACAAKRRPLQSERVDAGPWVARRWSPAHPLRGSNSVEEPLKHLMHEGGTAITHSRSESDRSAEASGGSKTAGDDGFLVWEATIGVNRRDDS